MIAFLSWAVDDGEPVLDRSLYFYEYNEYPGI